jgi:8-oxo-dGTP pyrophosphatase MutT (NUDIX family)
VEVVSCGGVIFNDEAKVLLLRKADEGRWCIPKGQVEEGETYEEAALREIQEECGLVCRLLEKLTEVRYKYYWPPEDINYAKEVKYYLAEVVGGTIRLEKGFDRHLWCSQPKALALVAYENDRQVIREAFRRMATRLGPQARRRRSTS